MKHPVSSRWFFVLLVCPLLLTPCSGTPGIGRHESSVTLQSARAVREAFEKTVPVSRDSGTLKIPAIVSDKLFARFFVISKATYPHGNDASWVKQQFALDQPGIGRYFIFTGDHSLIEKALIAGQFNPNQIMSEVGFGPGARCSSNQNYWLVVFRPKSRPVSAVYQHNLQYWFQHVYGKHNAPNISQAVEETLVSNRFSGLTGCPLDPSTGWVLNGNFSLCAPDFAATANALKQRQCANTEALRYAPANRCPSDQVLQSFGPNPSARDLRAWLFFVNDFSEFFTGTGYAGNQYITPEVREFWVDNEWLRNLPEVELLKVECPRPAARNAEATSGLGQAFRPGTSSSGLVVEYPRK